MQVGSAPVLDLADPGNFRMVVEDFGGEEMNFADEQHACNQGVHPIIVSMISQASQLDNRALIEFCLKMLDKPLDDL